MAGFGRGGISFFRKAHIEARMKKQLIIARAIGLVIALFLSGCATMEPQDESSGNDSKNVRVSGDVTESSVSRKGF